MIKIKQISNEIEHQIITGAIINDEVLSGIIPMVSGNMYQEELFKSPHSKIIYKWCLEYYQRYNKSPHGYIQDIYLSELNRGKMSGDVLESVGGLLSSLSDKYDNETINNPGYLLDIAEKYLRDRAVHILIEEMKEHRDQGSLDKAEELVAGFQRPSLITSQGINPLTDKEIIRSAFEDSPEPIVKLPGRLGRMINEHLIREGFVAFMGPEKRGKTWCLIEMGLRSLLCRRNVAFFSVGDMSVKQLALRTHIRIAGVSDRSVYCQSYCYPVLDCVKNQNNECSLPCRTGRRGLGFEFNISKEERIPEELVMEAPRSYRPCSACRKGESGDWQNSVWWEKSPIMTPLTWRKGFIEARKFNRRGRGRQIKMDCFANNSVNVDDIERQLNLWERYEGFVPDVVIIDYADILAPMSTQRDYRHQQNETWMALRRLSQERKCLLITATQSDAASYFAQTLNRSHFSEDKRKFSHVSAMFGLNQTESEKRMGLFRINTILVREGECDPSRCATLLQNLKRGRFFMDSF